MEDTNIEATPSWSQKLQQELEYFSGTEHIINSTKTAIQKYNSELSVKRLQQDAIDNEIKKFQEFNNHCIELKAKQKNLLSEKETLGTKIKNFTECNAAKLAEVEAEKKTIEINLRFLEAYRTIISNLKEYRNQLPQELSAGLAERVKDYYNIINAHDPEFERLHSLDLPKNAGEKISLIFVGENITKDALHVLSEGHIKVLGLAILLAKIVHEKSGFIVFDDIVNAIDDDHRSGIADLLISHPDFSNRQQIITCHGEQFINKLEHKLGVSRASKEVNRYQFYPVNSITERGVKPSIGAAKHYLVQAREQFDRNSLKDAAAKCRQTVESLSETLWKRLGREKQISLTVKMRAPRSQPDLYTIVGSLKKELKNINKESVTPHSLISKRSSENFTKPD
ncbi:MAG: hypothetical protein D3908_05960 [Candidatus Electrothrix sp. AUS4]|nr:hypothetical protein [Candidatus Electrothrix sp. AUS4]